MQQGDEGEAKRFSIDTKSTEFRSARSGFEHEASSSGSGISYTMRVILAFTLVSFMTALVAIGVLSYVWEQHFQTYTRENMQRIADTTAQAIGTHYAASGNQWYSGALNVASSTHDLNASIGVRVVDSDGNVLYDDCRTADNMAAVSLVPANKESLATSRIVSPSGEDLGMVQVWVYGSSTLLTQADQEFRERSYQAMIFSTLIAIMISLVVGILFARSLVNPINRITRAAKAIGEGDLSARTNLEGDDEISNLGMTFDIMAEAVQKDRQLERRLTTDVAHELRTPLMAIQSTVEAILDGVFEADEQRLETINSEVRRLSRLVDAILKLSRLESGGVRLKEEVVNVGELISGLISTHEAFLKDSGLELYYNADPDVYVWGDPDYIRQAVANLISNAVRYTPEGSITVSVKRGELMGSISVADTGIGLSEEDAKMVFSRFWRAEAGRTREAGGLGVGLSVVKEIVDQHGGWIRVEGKPNEGATFTIYIPLYDEERVAQQRQKQRRRLGAREEHSESQGLKDSRPVSRWAAGHETHREDGQESEYWN